MSELISCNDHLEPITFTHVPQITQRAVPELIARLGVRQRKPRASAESFGALVIREGGPELAERLLKRLPGTGVVDWAEFKDPIAELHSDRLPTARGESVTAHVTLHGKVEVAVLVGPLKAEYAEENRVVEYPAGVVHESKDIMTERLFDESVLCLDAVQLAAQPMRALRATLDQGDILVFDDRQMHAVQSLSAERLSRAYYLLPAQPAQARQA